MPGLYLPGEKQDQHAPLLQLMPTQVLGHGDGIFWQRAHEEALETQLHAGQQPLWNRIWVIWRDQGYELSKQVAVFLTALRGPLGKQRVSCKLSATSLPTTSFLVTPGDVFVLGLQFDQLPTDSLYLANSSTLQCLDLQIFTGWWAISQASQG